MNLVLILIAVFLIPLGIGIVWKSKKIGTKIRSKIEDTEQMERNREDNVPEIDYVKNIDAVTAGLGFMIFLSGLGLIVIGVGAVK